MLTTSRRRLRLEPLEDRRLLSASAGLSAVELFEASPALFAANQGQFADSDVRFVLNGSGANVLITDRGPVFQLSRMTDDTSADAATALTDALPHLSADVETEQFSVSFEDANSVTPVGLQQSATVYNYFVGDQSQWRSNVPTYQAIAYNGLYSGIDLLTYGGSNNLKYEFHVSPGADYQQIRVHYDGVEGLSIDADGVLHVQTALGELTDAAPVIYQEINGQRVTIAGQFRLIDANTYTIELEGQFNPAAELVIDPQLSWATYFGRYWGGGHGVATDNQGNAFVAGSTYGGYGVDDAVVIKYNSSGTILWQTYVGGGDTEEANAIALDGAGNVFIAGSTKSTNLAGCNNAGHSLSSQAPDAFLAKLTSSGALSWSTYLGGTLRDEARGLVVDSQGEIVLTGDTLSSDFEGANNLYHGTGSYDGDAFVAKYSSSGSQIWASYFGGSGGDSAQAITADNQRNYYLTGYTNSSGLPTAVNSFHSGYGEDAFVARLASDGTIAWINYLGGGNTDVARSIALDASGNAMICGATYSKDFAGTNNGLTAFVAQVTSSGRTSWVTYVSGTTYELGAGIAVDRQGNAIITGETCSADLPGATNAFHAVYDAFVTKLTNAGKIVFSMYLGGTDSDYGRGIALDQLGNAFVTGETSSFDFAGATNSPQVSFVAKIDVRDATTTTVTASPSTSSSYGQVITFTAKVTGTVSGTGTPTGMINFMEGTTVLGSATLNANGQASWSTTALHAGSHTITTSYVGDATFLASTASVSETINKASLIVRANNATKVYGATLLPSSATYSGFVNGETAADLTTLPTLSTTATAASNVGVYPITASGADAGPNYTVSYVAGTLTIDPANTTATIVGPAATNAFGTPVTFTATLSPVAPGAGTPSGIVVFKDGTTMIGSAVLDSSGVATLTTSTLALGSHHVTAEYAGSQNFVGSASSATATNVIASATSLLLVASDSPSACGQTITFTATVSANSPSIATPGGVVVFKDGVTVVATATLQNGVATFSTSTLKLGTHTVTASYQGTTNFTASTASTASIRQIVRQKATNTALVASQSEVTLGQTVTFTATVTTEAGLPMPTGKVRFYSSISPVYLGTSVLDASGHATLSVSSLAVGSNQITAIYSGDTTSSGSSSATTEIVHAAPTTVVIASALTPSAVGQAVTFTVTVSAASQFGTPTGQVVFYDGQTVLGTRMLSSGKASLNTTSLTAGTHTITAEYQGNTKLAADTGTFTQVVNQATTSTTLSASASVLTYGKTVTFTAEVKSLVSGSRPTAGTITFRDGSTILGTVAVDRLGRAKLAIASLTAGSHTISATYNGASDFVSSSASLVKTVMVGTTSTRLAVSTLTPVAGQPVTLTVSVQATYASTVVPTGTVTFMDGTTVLGTATLDAAGKASLTITASTVGLHKITVVYGGSVNYRTSTSATTTLRVSPLSGSSQQASSLQATASTGLGSTTDLALAALLAEWSKQ